MNKTGRKLVIVSGYYGFNNLGDEAILEELVKELKALVSAEDIVVLSQDPQATAARYGVRAQNRWRIGDIVKLLGSCKLFISGGGGLFQDTASVKSIIYYGGLINLAKLAGARVMVYAQGLGPLHASLSKLLTRQTFSRVDAIAVRDAKSHKMLADWHIPASLTGDPVWLLSPGQLPEPLSDSLNTLKGDGKKILALSLRDGGGFSDEHIKLLATTLSRSLPEHYVVLPLPLQAAQDNRPLDYFKSCYAGKTVALDLSGLARPSQWLALIGSCDMVMGMRLHSLIMALASAVPVVGIAYDPKVQAVLAEFEQPELPYLDSNQSDPGLLWQNTINQSIQQNTAEKQKIARILDKVRSGACQNQSIIAKMLQN